MKFPRVIALSVVVSWVIWCSPAPAQDTSFIPLGIDLSVNGQLVRMGMAEKSLNFLSDQQIGTLRKRDGYSVWSTGLGGVATKGYYTGLYSFQPKNGGKRLLASFVHDDTTSTFKTNPYGYLVVSTEWGKNLVASTAYPFHYKTDPINCVTYNDMVVIGRKHGRPLRYVGGKMASLVEPPPGTWEYTPMAETTTTANKLNGQYYYAMRPKKFVPDTTAIYPLLGFMKYIGYPDSMNLSNLSYRVRVDSDWVFIHSPELIPTSNTYDYNYTSVQICRTRADRTESDSFFLVGEFIVYDTVTGITTKHFIDSVKDASLGTGIYVFAGFVDTVFRTMDTLNTLNGAGYTADSAVKMGGIVWKSTIRASSGNKWKGIARGYKEIGDASWTATLYGIAYYDTATGSVSPLGPTCRIPVAYRCCAYDTIYDSALQFYVPPIPRQKRHLQRFVCRSQETRTRELTIDTTRQEWVPARLVEGDCGSQACWYYTCYDDYGNETKTNMVTRSDGSHWCSDQLVKLRKYDTSIYYTEFHIIDTIKTNTDTVTSLTYTDTVSWTGWYGKPTVEPSEYIGPLNYPVVLNDRLLMSSRDNQVWFCAWNERGPQPGIFGPGDAFAVNLNDEITGMIVWGNALYVFQNNGIYRATEVSRTAYNVDPYQVGIGCVAPQTLKNTPSGGIVFLHSSGVQSLTGSLQSQFKEVGGTMDAGVSRPIRNLLNKYSIDALREAVIWYDEDQKNMWLSFPTLDTSFILDFNGQWHQATLAPKIVVAYDTTYETDLRPDKQRLFILNSAANVYKYGGVKTDLGAAITATWKSREIYQTGEYGRINAFGIWRYSNSSNGFNFSVYDLADSGAVRTVRDTLNLRYQRKDISCLESQGFKIQIVSNADSLAVNRIDLEYEATGPSPVD